jgi:hypothetical protein
MDQILIISLTLLGILGIILISIPLLKNRITRSQYRIRVALLAFSLAFLALFCSTVTSMVFTGV